MKIACLYFPTSSVGGIATEVASLRAEALRRGDTFHVLVCANASTHKITRLSSPKRIRGGDTFIDIHGYAPHHRNLASSTARWLNSNYDLVYLAFLCPHPTKAYGDAPVFLDLLRGITLPIVGRITDGYYETYAEWGDATSALCTRMTISTEAYTPAGFLDRFPCLAPLLYGKPFDPQPITSTRSAERSMAWIAQWKAIKGVHNFLKYLPQVEGTQDLYSNGILYYQLRTEPEWKAAVAEDRFKGFNGEGRAIFYGWQPPNVIREALGRAWFMPEFQGFGKPKYEGYRRGASNNTIFEALYYGCTPVIPRVTIDNEGVPPESAHGVTSFEEAVAALNGPMAARPDLGKQWVLDNFSVGKIYIDLFGGLV